MSTSTLQRKATIVREYRDEYIDILKSLNGDFPGRECATRYIESSDIWAYGKPLLFSYVPNLLGASDIAFISDMCATTHRILTKVIRHFLDDPTYRTLFHFSPAAERLILLPCDYEELLPLARFDLFLDEGNRTFKFCEFNTDGSGAMSRDFEMGRALALGQTYQQFAERHRISQFELFDSWVHAFIRNYRQCPYAQETPTIAITDFRESGVFSDFNRFIAAFERAGFPARFVDVREFSFDGQHLKDPSDNTIIDAVYRRAVTSEMLTHSGQCDALIDAVRAQKVCLIGHFRTTIVHTKMISAVLFAPETRAFLSAEECAFIDAHVPHTYRLCSNSALDKNDIVANKDAWILKPEDDYGGHGVFPGISTPQAQWETLINEHMDAAYVVQEYCLPHRVRIALANTNDEAQNGHANIEEWESMFGAYVYNGKFVGTYSRDGQGGIIATDRGALSVCGLKVDAD